MNLVEYRDLKVTIQKDILQIKKLDIKKEKRYAVVGPSGSGKSTFLRLTNLLQPLSSGTMNLFGEQVTAKGMANHKKIHLQRQMVYVSQKPVMFDLSVAENVAMGLKFRGVSKMDTQKQVHHFLELVGLKGYGDRRAITLSGGEAQRIALARALIIQPQLLLLDEPTSNLDPSNIQIIEQVVSDIHQQTGVTIMMVTHNLQQAKRVGDEIIFIHQGKVMEKQEKEKFFAAPQTTELSDFLSGRMIY